MGTMLYVSTLFVVRCLAYLCIAGYNIVEDAQSMPTDRILARWVQVDDMVRVHRDRMQASGFLHRYTDLVSTPLATHPASPAVVDSTSRFVPFITFSTFASGLYRVEIQQAMK